MTITSQLHTNRLSHETSPYLLQHAHNPVDWWPWNEAALQAAREQHKPILLSIGYSACHWCHVMAHESFEDEATAAVMNTLFINIKVDREERPDLDKIYQTAHQLMNQRGGGWPLTMILTPDTHTPFFAGTYLPPQARYGMPAFTDLLQRVAEFYRQHITELAEQHQAFLNAFEQLNGQPGSPATLDASPIAQARQQLEANFDSVHGGFGKAPKFPHPSELQLLLHHWADSRGKQADTRALQMLRTTLSAMAQGGLFDQLGGGFFRYSVDDVWLIPHFEKMLYDNGLLLSLYAEAAVATTEPLYQRICHDTAQWTMREMQAPQGGFYAALDADSDGHEGKFYVWTPDSARALLTDDEYAVISRVFGLDDIANFEGAWHLHLAKGTDRVATELQQDETAVHNLLESARAKLFTAREQRVRPGRDEKILTSWNALMIKGMAAAGRRLQCPDYIASAQRAVDFIRTQLFRDGRLLAVYKDGQAKLMAYLDDYAFLLDALLECLQAQWRNEDLVFAQQLADNLLTHFADATHGGFYFTAHDHETLLHRPKPLQDEAIPAGNAIAAVSLQRLGYLLGESRYLNAAEQTLRCGWAAMQQHAYAHAALLHALQEYLIPPRIILLRGASGALPAWQLPAQQHYQPRQLCVAIPSENHDLPPALQAKVAHPDQVLAYVCEGMQCQAPLTHLDEFVQWMVAAKN
jgi:uncharacterized protein